MYKCADSDYVQELMLLCLLKKDVKKRTKTEKVEQEVQKMPEAFIQGVPISFVTTSISPNDSSV